MLARNNQLTLYIPTTYVTRIACIPHVGNIHEIERKKKICAKENNYTRQYLRDSAICPRLHGSNNFTIHREKIQNAAVQFSLKTTHQNLISKQQFFYLAHRIHNGIRLGPLHGLTSEKISLKTITLLYQVKS